jgi:hypothetical protein
VREIISSFTSRVRHHHLAARIFLVSLAGGERQQREPEPRARRRGAREKGERERETTRRCLVVRARAVPNRRKKQIKVGHGASGACGERTRESICDKVYSRPRRSSLGSCILCPGPPLMAYTYPFTFFSYTRFTALPPHIFQFPVGSLPCADQRSKKLGKKRRRRTFERMDG